MTVFRKCAAKSANQGGTAVNFRPWQNCSFLPGTFFISSVAQRGRYLYEYHLGDAGRQGVLIGEFREGTDENRHEIVIRQWEAENQGYLRRLL